MLQPTELIAKPEHKEPPKVAKNPYKGGSKRNMFGVKLSDLIGNQEVFKPHSINIPLNDAAKSYIQELAKEILAVDDEKFLVNGRINFSLKVQKAYVDAMYEKFKSLLDVDFAALNAIYMDKIGKEEQRLRNKYKTQKDILEKNFHQCAKIEFNGIFARVLALKVVQIIRKNRITFPQALINKQQAINQFVSYFEELNSKIGGSLVRDIDKTGEMRSQGHFKSDMIEPFTHHVRMKSYLVHKKLKGANELFPLSPYALWTDPSFNNEFCSFVYSLIKGYLLKGPKKAAWNLNDLNDKLFLLTLKRKYGVGKFSIDAALEFLKYTKDKYGASRSYFIPCAGYGERLVGGLLDGSVKAITALDTDSELCTAYTAMFDTFKEKVPALASKRLTVLQKPIEDTSLEEIGVQDCAFSCPPYRRFEGRPRDYVEAGDKTTNEKHCALRYKDNLNWLEKFFYPLIIKTFRSLRAGGVFGFVMNKPLNDLLLKMISQNPHLQSIDGMAAQQLKTIGYSYITRNANKTPTEEMILLRKLTDLRLFRKELPPPTAKAPLIVKIQKPRVMWGCKMGDYFRTKAARIAVVSALNGVKRFGI